MTKIRVMDTAVLAWVRSRPRLAYAVQQGLAHQADPAPTRKAHPRFFPMGEGLALPLTWAW